LVVFAFLLACVLNTDAQSYCPSQSDFPWEEWIESVQIGDLSNENNGKSRDFNTAGYSNFTDLNAPSVAKGNSIEFSFSSGRSGTTPAGFWSVFIDFNQDGDFTDTGENVLRQEVNAQTVAGRFDIPATAESGTTRLRIILAKEGFAQACDDPDRGEVEDYSLNIAGNTPQDLPDLLSSNFNPPARGVTNSIVNFTVDLKNEGRGAATDNFEIGLFLSTDPSLSADDIDVGEIPTGNFAPLSFIRNVPGAFNLAGVAPKTYFLLIVVDRDNDITESNENNNLVSTLFTVEPAPAGTGADLELSISANNANPAAFQTIRLQTTVTNKGPDRLQSAEIHIPASPDYVVAGNGRPILNNGNLVIENNEPRWQLNGLEVGETASLEIDVFTLDPDADPCVQVVSALPGDPDSAPNNYDCASVPQEDDEGSLRQGVGSGSSFIDLLIPQLSAPTSEMTNSRVNFTLSIQNDGNINSSFFNVSLFLSDNGLLDPADEEVFRTLSIALQPSERFTLPASESFFTTNGIAAGNYFLIAKIDSGDNIDESDEANNLVIQAFEVSPEEPDRIDYALSDLQAPASGLSSATIDLTVDLAKLGNSTVFSQTFVGIFLSTDNAISPDDLEVGFLKYSTSLPDAMQDDRAAQFSLKGVVPGDYFLILKIDRDELFAEPNEDNNILSQAFTVLAEPTPDCAVALGGDRILCSETIGDVTRLFIQDEQEAFQYDLAQDGNILDISSLGAYAFDSTLIENSELIYQDASGQVLFQKAIPQNVLDILPTISAATRLSDGNFLLGGRFQTILNFPFTVELRLVKTDGNLNLIDSTVISTSSSVPANSNNQINYLIALDNGEAGIAYTTFVNLLVSTPTLVFAKVSNDLTTSISSSFGATSIRSVTETPCGDLLAEVSLGRFGQKGSTRGEQFFQLSKDGFQRSPSYGFFRIAVDRLPTVLSRSFQGILPEPFQMGYSFALPFALQDSTPPFIDVELYNPGPDTTFLKIPYIDFNYATRNGQTALAYGILNGALTAVGTDCQGPSGVDLEVSLSVDDERPAVFQNVLYTLTVRNAGTEDATGIVIDFDHGAQESPKRLAFVSQTDPTYNSWEGRWYLGDLPAGGARTMNLELFVLSAAAPETSLMAFVESLDQTDVNPANDQASASIDLTNSATSRLGLADQRSSKTTGTALLQLFPSPARNHLTVSLQSTQARKHVLQIYDAKGLLLRSIPFQAEVGFQQLQVDVTELGEGMYLLRLPGANGRQQAKRFVKIE
ncbi:MAG: CARDB domain-containing protein, partial [Bacteroidota bacterium]